MNEIDLQTEARSALYSEGFSLVWKTLNAINVNEHTEKKMNLTYLSWAWAYQTMMDHFPTFNYEFRENEIHPDDSVTVWVDCSIEYKGMLLSKTMWLPVMDHRNNAIKNPTARQISDAKMRCLTKCISMFGLGAYIYAGEDLPQAPTEEAEEKPKATSKKASVSKPSKEEVKEEISKPSESEEGYPVVMLEDDKEFYLMDDDAAEEYAVFFCKAAEDMHSDSMENLVSFWKSNIIQLNYLEQYYIKQFNKVKARFGAIKSNLVGESND